MKLNINSARKGNSSYSFSPLSLVTLDFGRLQPVQCVEGLLGANYSRFKGKGLLRCTPQVFPPFGRMNVKSASFFVPLSQIFSWSSAFRANNNQWRGHKSDILPYFPSHDINLLFLSESSFRTIVSSNPVSSPSLSAFDFAFPSSTGRSANRTNLDYYKLTNLGWKYYAILKSLGYDFVTYPLDTSGSLSYSDHATNSSTSISLVPFLAYCKIWNDYFCNSYQSDNTFIADYLQSIYLNETIVYNGVTLYDSSTMQARHYLISRMIKSLFVPYESNLYTNAWNNVNDPTGVELSRINQVNQQSLISPFGDSQYGEFGSLATSSSHNIHKDNHSPSSFSELGHKTLAAFDKFVRRRNLVGSKAVQQIYALFGIMPDEFSKDYVVKIQESSSRVNFSAITSHSDTENGSVGKPLGAFAGIGLAGYDVDFSYKCNSNGVIISLVWLNIDPILMHGLSPLVLRTKPLDFYNPDFDGKAYRPIPFSEVTGAKVIDDDNYNANSIYGYVNMYDDYRYMGDVVAGNFLDDTTKNFAFMRDLTRVRYNLAAQGDEMKPQTNVVQYWFMDGNSDITNPFLTAPQLGDRFWFCIDWDIKCTLPILSSENSFDLDGEGSLSIEKNGNGIA